MCLVEFEQFHDVAQTFHLVLKSFVNEDVNVELFVAPVNFKNRLEPSKELVCLCVRSGNYLCNAFLFVAEGWRIDDPSQRTECKGLWFFPLLTHDVVPFFKYVGILLKVSVFGPTSKALNLFEAKLEVHHYLIVKLLTVGLEFDPEFVCGRKSLFVELNGYCVSWLFFFINIFFFTLRFNLFNFQMTE